MPINMKSIAAQAGVSVATVSGLLIVRKWSTQEKNLAIVEDLTMRQNRFAQGLSTGKQS